MKKAYWFLLVALVVLMLAGCSQIKAGYITNKAFEPAHTDHYTTCNMIGKVTVCTPHTRHVKDKWRFDLRNGDETGSRYVTQESFDDFNVGDYVSFEEDK